MVEPHSPDRKEGSALSRWSRRKQLAKDRHSVEELPGEDLAEAQPTGELLSGNLAQPGKDSSPAADASQALPADTENTDAGGATSGDGADGHEDAAEPRLTDADMPTIESLDSSSDVSCFFNAGVSEELRQAALRHLLRLPAFNITDGLNDYDEDYTYFEPLGDIVTSDMRFHEKRKARLAEQEEAARLAELESEQQEATGETADEAAAPDEDVDEKEVAFSDDAAEQGEPIDETAIADESDTTQPIAAETEYLPPANDMNEVKIADSSQALATSNTSRKNLA